MGIISDWLQNRQDALLEEREEQVSAAMEKLSRIPTGKILTDFTKTKRMFIRINDELDSDTMAQFHSSAFIDVSDSCPISSQPTAIAHELRHAWQEAAGLSLRRKTNARDSILSVRFEEADAFAIEAQVAWELTRDGIEPKAWKEFSKNQPCVSEAFENVVKNRPGADRSGEALFAAFNAWFEDRGLKDDYDSHSITNARDYQESRRKRAMTFDKKRDADAPARMSREYFREFGQWLCGINYLKGVDTLDPFYTENMSSWNERRLQKLENDYPALRAATSNFEEARRSFAG